MTFFKICAQYLSGHTDSTGQKYVWAQRCSLQSLIPSDNSFSCDFCIVQDNFATFFSVVFLICCFLIPPQLCCKYSIPVYV